MSSRTSVPLHLATPHSLMSGPPSLSSQAQPQGRALLHPLPTPLVGQVCPPARSEPLPPTPCTQRSGLELEGDVVVPAGDCGQGSLGPCLASWRWVT